MDINTIIDIDSDEEKKNLLYYLKEHFTEESQNIFINNFYLTIFNNEKENYPIKGDPAMEWLDYSRKDVFKRFFEKILTKDKDYIIIQNENNKPKAMGHLNETFKFTKDAFIKMGIHAKTEKGEQIKDYYLELQKIVIQYGVFQYKKHIEEKYNIILEKLKQSELENEELKNLIEQDEGQIYIFKTDITNPDSYIKVGYSKNTTVRIQPFKAVCPNGRVVFTINFDNSNIKSIEKIIHNILKEAGCLVNSKTFRISIEEAKL